MAVAAETQRGGVPDKRPLSDYPGPQADIVGSVLEKKPGGELIRHYYYRGHIPGGEHVIGYSGAETRIEHAQTPGKAIEVFNIADRKPAPVIPLRRA